MIKQTVHFATDPKTIYDCLMDQAKHAGFTGAAAEIDNQVDGKFSVWDGYATGENLELDPGKKIVQSWRASDWPEGENSTVTFELKADQTGTNLTLTHEGVPKKFEKEVEEGWNDYYWNPLTAYLEK